MTSPSDVEAPSALRSVGPGRVLGHAGLGLRACLDDGRWQLFGGALHMGNAMAETSWWLGWGFDA
jgi:hypothetical protein